MLWTTTWMRMSQWNDSEPCPDSWGFVLTRGRMSKVFYPPILVYENVGAPNRTQTWKSLKLFPQVHISKLNGYLLVSCAKHWFLVFIVHIYLFLVDVYGSETIFCYFWSSPPVIVVFCCSTDGKHREAKECFIKLFIVDNCTISLIIRTIVNISAVYSEMDFIILCALKRDFGIFIKENSGVLMPLPPKMI